MWILKDNDALRIEVKELRAQVVSVLPGESHSTKRAQGPGTEQIVT